MNFGLERRNRWRFFSALSVFLSLSATAGAPSITQLSRTMQNIIHDGQDYKVESYGRNYVSFDSDLPEKYRPESKNIFKIKSYWVSEKDWHVFQGLDFSKNLKNDFNRTLPSGERQFKVLVHPVSENFFSPFLKNAIPADTYWGTPLASARTLVIWKEGEESKAYLGKLGLDSHIGSTWRIIRPSEIARSVGTSDVLSMAKPALPKDFSYFPEVYGITPKGSEAGGMLLRELPDELKSGEFEARPLMSLFESTSPFSAPPFVDMIKKSGLSPQKFFKKNLIAPFIDQWLELALNHGINEEPHSQNLLMILDRAGMPTRRFAHWDLGGFSLDLPFRESKGLPIPANLPHIRGVALDYSLEEVALRYRSLQWHFVNGVIYNVDQRVPVWMKNGWVKKAPWKEGELEDIFHVELARIYEEKTGLKLLNPNDLVNFAPNIVQGREAIQKMSLARPQAAFAEALQKLCDKNFLKALFRTSKSAH